MTEHEQMVVSHEYRRAMLIAFGNDWQTVHLAVKAESARLAKLTSHTSK